jgi:glycolate oxidase FAD binding subunit
LTNVTLFPRTEADVIDIVRSSASAGSKLRICCRDTKKKFGRKVEAEIDICLSKLTGVTYYDPKEMVITARAGTPIAELDDLIQQNGQHLPFEPLNFGDLYGTKDRGSLGGAVSVNASGSRRIIAGAMRDHVLGVRAVNGLSQLYKSGGRVIKNVTGFDLSKLVTGAHGTLGI